MPHHTKTARSIRVLAALAAAGLLAACTNQPRHEPTPDTGASGGGGGGDLRTVAERSGWRATATHREVVELVDALARLSPLAQRDSMGQSYEGRDLPLLIIADPPVRTPEEARRSGKPVFFVFANIHAGEVAGKEASLMFARELLLEPGEPRNRLLLDNLVLLIAPIYNADGNERFAPDNRPGQDGPEHGMGVRPNAQGLDLNRDYMKLDAPESRAMVRLLNEWDPHVIMDLHTTNGSRHRYTLTYEAPLHPASAPAPVAYLRDELLPAVSARMEAETGYASFYYGNFDPERTRWFTYDHRPRFGANYHGLRGRISILSEAYSYAPYKDRVLATLAFVRHCAEHAANDARRILALARETDEDTTARGQRAQDDVPVRAARAALPDTAHIRTWAWAEESSPTARRPDGAPRREIDESRPIVLEVAHEGRFEPTRGVRRPLAYIVPPGNDRVIENLHHHGVRVHTITEALTTGVLFADETNGESGASGGSGGVPRGTRAGDVRTIGVERATVTEIVRAERAFQGVHLVRVETETSRADLDPRALPVGTHIVTTAQPLGTLAVLLLEPESDDGLTAWGFFDDALRAGAPHPILRVSGGGGRGRK
ncbi:MAG: hypothetical protein EA379_03325 [Phycisphaerales bacterium]|nr:MAG: hypothetical protein EA379_03325 [Phycisphaerales bacterium]